MDVSRLSKRWPLLSDYLKSSGYSEGWCRTVNRLLREAITLCGNPPIKDYHDFYEYIKGEYAEQRQVSIRSAINQIAYFDKQGLYPAKGRRSIFSSSATTEQLCSRYQKLVSLLDTLLGKEHLQASTISGYHRTAVHFLCYLESKGINKLHDCTEDVLLGYFYQDGRCVRGYRISQTLRKVLLLLSSYCRKGDCARIIRFLPRSVQTRKPFRQLTSQELIRMKDVLLSDGGEVSLRDKAIVVLTLYAALRTRELAELTLDDVDFKYDRLIVRSVDGGKRTLPLRPVVGNALFRYIREERPDSDRREIFLTTISESTPMTFNAIRAAAGKVYDAAGVRMDGRNRGLQPLRRGFATALLGNDVSSPTVKAVMGISTPSVARNYSISGYEQLKLCGLDIGRWQLGKEVLEDV